METDEMRNHFKSRVPESGRKGNGPVTAYGNSVFASSEPEVEPAGQIVDIASRRRLLHELSRKEM
jgi:hypothetical protein